MSPVKTEDALYVKASGVRLRDVAKDTGHSRVPLDLAKKALAGDADADESVFTCSPRPSLETYFHALSGRVVAHTHALGALLYACSADTGTLPEGVTGEVAYARPGRGVAVAMQSVLTNDAEQAVILLSHGLVVIADDVERAIARTLQIDGASRARFAELPNEDELIVDYMQAAAIAVTGGFVRLLPSRSAEPGVPPRYLFPDVVICASTMPVRSAAPSDAKALAPSTIVATGGRAHVLADGEGRRVLVAKNEEQLNQSTEVLAAHDWLEGVLRYQGKPRYLPDDEPASLLDLPSEQYRIRLAGGQG